jgi:hypothetical protein
VVLTHSVGRKIDCLFKAHQLNHTYRNVGNSIELSVFHVNIQSLNAKNRALQQLLQVLCVEFDVIVLSEIWTSNIQFYCNIFEGYNFYYSLRATKRLVE